MEALTTSPAKRIFLVLMTFVVGLTLSFGITTSEPQSAYAASKKPAKVTGVKCVKKNTSSFTVAYKKAKNAKKYQIAYKKKSAKKWSYKTTKSKRYTASRLAANTTYQVKVRGINGKKNGKWSKTVSIKTAKKASKKKTTTKAQQSTQTVTFNATQTQILAAVNKARSSKYPVKLDSRLNATAQAKARDMYNRKKLDHHSPSLGYWYNQYAKAGIKAGASAENIAYGQTSVSSVMNSWMNSKLHRDNIRNTAYNRIGVGRCGNYWVLQFARL